MNETNAIAVGASCAREYLFAAEERAYLPFCDQVPINTNHRQG